MSRKRTYDQTFRMETVSLVNTSNKSVAAVARELDICNRQVEFNTLPQIRFNSLSQLGLNTFFFK